MRNTWISFCQLKKNLPIGCSVKIDVSLQIFFKEFNEIGIVCGHKKGLVKNGIDFCDSVSVNFPNSSNFQFADYEIAKCE